MRKALVLAGLLVLGFAPSAKAVPVEVLYSVSATASILATPIATLTGTATVRYQNATALGSNILNGAVRFQSFNATGPINLTLGFVLSGNLTIALGPIGGTPGNVAFNLDRIVETDGSSNGSSNHPMLAPGSGVLLRQGAANPNLSGPMGTNLIMRLIDQATGIVLDSWLDADGQTQGQASNYVN